MSVAKSAAASLMLPVLRQQSRPWRRMTALKRASSALHIGAFLRPQLQFCIVTNARLALIRRSESADGDRL
jgi:hypothetical protein